MIIALKKRVNASCHSLLKFYYEFLLISWFRATNNKFLDEASKKTRDITPLLKNEGGVQTRYPKEAGALTGFSKVCMRSNRNDSLKEIAWDQGNKFKPDNHVQTLEVLDEGSKINEQNNSLSNDSSSDDNKRASLQRVRNFGRSNCQLRTRGFKNSKRDSQNAISSNKKLDKCNSFTNGIEGQNLAGIFPPMLTFTCLGDDLNFKTGQKSIKNLVHSKSKEEQANSENWDSENKELNKEKLSTSQKEKICQNWIKYLNKLENQMNIEITQPVSGESIPEFCTNKSCPISEFKIPRTLKIQKLAKKVILRKVFFQNSFERWYCLKWMKAHNDSWYCYYWGQIYFNEDDELESDGKAWIWWDDCNKWVSNYYKNKIKTYIIYQLIEI